MKITVLILSLLFLTLGCFSQDSLAETKRYPYSDTTLSEAYLADTSILKNMVEVQNGENAIICISLDSLESIIQRDLLLPYLMEYYRKENKKLQNKLNHIKKGKIKNLNGFYSSVLRGIVSNQIIAGKARVYDKQNRVYIKNIFFRIERVISTGYRHFYFSKTDRRYLYSYQEFTGIIPNELMPELQ